MPRMLFVVGVGRSGTSLLQSMLAAHPEIAFLPETSFFRRYVFGRQLEALRASGGKEQVIQTLENDKRVQHLQLDSEELINELDSDSFSDLAVYRQIAKHLACEAVAFVGDKDPRLVELLPLVHACFPDAYVIHLVRDPRDVLVSKQKASWSRSRPWWQHAFANRVQFDLGHINGQRHFASRYCVLRYEELLASPEKVLNELSEQLGIEYSDQMLTGFGDAAKRLVREDELQWKSETTGPLLRKNVGKWKTSLRPFQLAVTERVCRPNMRFGTYPESDKQGFMGMLGNCFGSLLALCAPLYRAIRNKQAMRVKETLQS